MDCIFSSLAWIIKFCRVDPLGNDEHIHPPEEEEKEDDLGNELEEEVNVSLEVESIEALHADTERHLENTKNDCNFHFQVVCIAKILVTLSPSWVYASGVNAVIFKFGITCLIIEWLRVWVVLNGCLAIARSEEIDRNSKEFIVDETIVGTKPSHQQ